MLLSPWRSSIAQPAMTGCKFIPISSLATSNRLGDMPSIFSVFSSSARISAWRVASYRRQFSKAPAMRARDLRVDRIERADRLADQRIARAVAGVEAQMVARKRADQRAHAVGILDVESRMLHQRAHAIDRVGQRRCRLQAHPFVEHQRIAAEAVVEMGERGVALWRIHARQRREARDHVGHVGGSAVMRVRRARRPLIVGAP